VLPLTDEQFEQSVECGRCGRVFVPADEPDRPAGPADPDELPPQRTATPAGKQAVAGLVLGVIGLTLCFGCCPFVGLPFGVLGIVFGMLGRRSENRGLAVGGIATGTVAVVIATLGGTVWLLLVAAG
jgi:hypothetical protein